MNRHRELYELFGTVRVSLDEIRTMFTNTPDATLKDLFESDDWPASSVSEELDNMYFTMLEWMALLGEPD